jgi:aspartate aminotransferase-like enzyme/GNAT superfamily N-acetyltransferase
VNTARLTFKVADQPGEIDQIHRLNYETFVEEIPQHEHNPDRSLVDKFHDENTYLIALLDGHLVGMMAVRANRPFSLDLKLADLDSYLPPHTSICEFRLLAVRPEHRGGQVLPGLMQLLNTWCLDHGHDLGIISGTTRQQKLYAHLGFKPFGPVVGAGDAQFQPMYLTVETADRQTRPLLRLNRLVSTEAEPISFLPGPVAIPEDVQRAFAARPISHRSEAFRHLLNETASQLRQLTNANHVTVMNGSGTTANDAVAAQLKVAGGRGLILTNGEFGERLLDHATRFSLDFDRVCLNWGDSFDFEQIHRQVLESTTAWIWAVHCETSTGVLNDLDALKSLASSVDARLAVDCIGSIGTVPIDLQGVFAATATSGKGLASFAGIAMVFLDHEPSVNPSIPRSLDLGYYATQCGVPYTLLSNPLAALHQSLLTIDPDRRYEDLTALSIRVRSTLERAGFRILAPVSASSPAVVTIDLGERGSSIQLGDALARAGYLTSYQSAYLRERNWLQICLMGEVREPELERLLGLLPSLSTDITVTS